MSSFVRRALLWLASRAVKAQDELAALGLDRPTSQPNKIHIRTKGKHGYELAQPQNALTSAGLLMEGQCAHGRSRERPDTEFRRPEIAQKMVVSELAVTHSEPP